MIDRAQLQKKLRALTASQASIQTLSLWLVHHRADAADAVSVWLEELLEAPEGKKLSMMYLANDALLQSRKKGDELKTAFAAVLEEAVLDLNRNSSTKALEKVDRILRIWGDRGVYGGPSSPALRPASWWASFGSATVGGVEQQHTAPMP